MNHLGARMSSKTLDRHYEDLVARTTDRNGPRAWIEFVLVQRRRLIAVVGWGLIAIAAALAVPILFARIADGGDSTDDAVSMAITFCVVVAIGSFAGWRKERSELELVAGVRLLAFRSLYALGMKSSGAKSRITSGRFTTQPMQLSQFAFVVDLCLTLLQAAAVAAWVIVTFGVIGVIALAGTLLSAGAAIALVHRIGVVYAKYLALESARVSLIRDVSVHASELEYARLDGFVPGWLQRAREAQEPVLRERARLQTANLLVASGTVPVVVVAATLAGMTSDPSGAGLISLLVASGMLAATLQEVVTNYRVVRLCVPMLREWDEDRSSGPAGRSPETWMHEIESGALVHLRPEDEAASSALTEAVTASAQSGLVGFVTSEPAVPESVTATWRDNQADRRGLPVDEILRDLELPDDVFHPGRSTTLSRGERSRLAIAMALAGDADACVIDGAALSALDPPMRRRVLSRASRDRRVVVLGSLQELSSGETVQRVAVHQGRLSFSSATTSVARKVEAAGVSHTNVLAVPSASGDRPADLPDAPIESRRSTLRSFLPITTRVLGPWGSLGIALSACAVALLSVALPLALESANDPDAHDRLPFALGAIAVATLLMLAGMGGMQFGLPVRRISALHAQIARRFPAIGSPARTGDIVGRYGEDLTSLQMDVPGRLVGTVAIVTSLIAFIVGSSFASPWLLVGAVFLIPPAFWLYCQGERRLVESTARLAATRGRFLLVTTEHLGSVQTRTNEPLVSFARAAVATEESTFIADSMSVIEAMMARRAELQIASWMILVVGLVPAAWMGADTAVLAPAVLAYFAYRVAAELPRLLESLQGLSVALNTAERVLALVRAPISSRSADAEPGQDAAAPLTRVADSMSGSIIRLDGPSGSGKTSALRALFARSDDMMLLGDDVPIAELTQHAFITTALRRELRPEEHPSTLLSDLRLQDRQRLLVEYASSSDYRLVALDESISSLTPTDSVRALEELSYAARTARRSFILVSHSADESTAFDGVITLGRGQRC